MQKNNSVKKNKKCFFFYETNIIQFSTNKYNIFHLRKFCNSLIMLIIQEKNSRQLSYKKYRDELRKPKDLQKLVRKK